MNRPLALAALIAGLFVTGGIARAQTPTETVAIDASEAARGVLHATLSIPVSAGPQTLVYPKWIPGEHGPNGAINELVGLRFSAGGKAIAWKRDLVDMFAFHVEVPNGATQLDVKLDYLLAAGTIASKERTGTARLLVFTPYAVLLYPQGAVNSAAQISASLTVPTGWQFATALPIAKSDGARAQFSTVSLETFVDSPILTGLYMRKIKLDDAKGLIELDLAGEAPENLAASDETIAKYRTLVREADAEYGARHFKNYHFLVTLSNLIDFNGIEHHESSDNRGSEDFMTDAETIDFNADLLPHEFTHSWNGKYRRPYDLQVTNYQAPERTDLLWVYEGLTQYLGDVLSTRCGLRTPADFREQLASTYANLDKTTGRLTRPLVDTATQAGWLYNATGAFAHARRGVDFYGESELMWLDVDSYIRQATNGKKSIDDFVRAFYGAPDSAPKVVTYDRADVIAALNTIAPRDWAAFFTQEIDGVTLHPPSAGFVTDGWKLEMVDEPTRNLRNEEKEREHVVALYSIGAIVKNTGEIVDVVDGSAAAKAGLAPYQKIVAIGGRRFSADALHAVLKATKTVDAPIPVVIDSFGAVSTVTLRYLGGERYPTLVPVAGSIDNLTPIVTPRSK